MLNAVANRFNASWHKIRNRRTIIGLQKIRLMMRDSYSILVSNVFAKMLLSTCFAVTVPLVWYFFLFPNETKTF